MTEAQADTFERALERQRMRRAAEAAAVILRRAERQRDAAEALLSRIHADFEQTGAVAATTAQDVEHHLRERDLLGAKPPRGTVQRGFKEFTRRQWLEALRRKQALVRLQVDGRPINGDRLEFVGFGDPVVVDWVRELMREVAAYNGRAPRPDGTARKRL